MEACFGTTYMEQSETHSTFVQPTPDSKKIVRNNWLPCALLQCHPHHMISTSPTTQRQRILFSAHAKCSHQPRSHPLRVLLDVLIAVSQSLLPLLFIGKKMMNNRKQGLFISIQPQLSFLTFVLKYLATKINHQIKNNQV